VSGAYRQRVVEVIPVLRWLHLVAAASWLGGMIALGAVVITLRRAGVERSVLQAAARAFARVSWAAMALAVATGIAQVHATMLPWSYGRLHLKITLVVVTVIAALIHQRIAKHLTGARRGLYELALLVLSLGIFAAAVRL